MGVGGLASGSVGKESAYSAEDTGFTGPIPGSERSPGNYLLSIFLGEFL